MDNINAAKVEKALSLLPDWRREKACAYRRPTDRFLCAEAYILLCQLLKEEYGIDRQPEFIFGPNGKPQLKSEPRIHFNLSHCPQGILCAIDDSPLGCDIECIDNELDEDMLRRCCSSDERTRILQSADPKEAFITLWTRKEAFLKLSGKGLSDDLPGLLECDSADNVEFETGINRSRGYIYTICRYKTSTIQNP